MCAVAVVWSTCVCMFGGGGGKTDRWHDRWSSLVGKVNERKLQAGRQTDRQTDRHRLAVCVRLVFGRTTRCSAVDLFDRQQLAPEWMRGAVGEGGGGKLRRIDIWPLGCTLSLFQTLFWENRSYLISILFVWSWQCGIHFFPLQRNKEFE